MLLLSLSCLNANPNLILGSLVLSKSSDQLFVVLKTSGNTLTLLYIGLLSNLFVTNTMTDPHFQENTISSPT